MLRAFAVLIGFLVFHASINSALSAEEELSSLPRPSFGAELTSPWTTDARPWLLGGIATTTLLLILEDPVVDPTQAEVVEHRPIGKFSKIGDYGGQLIPNGLYALGMFSHALLDGNALSMRRAELMLKASLYAVTVSTILKHTVREPRPADRADLHSFPSGHTTSAFSFASLVAAEHSLPYGIGAIALASLTAASRINDNRHYLHDVVAGATIGTAFGLGMSAIHRNARDHSETQSETLSFQAIPLYSTQIRGAALWVEF